MTTSSEHHELTKDVRAGERVQRWYCSDCGCEHTGSVLSGVVMPAERGTQLQSLREAESERAEREDYERG